MHELFTLMGISTGEFLHWFLAIAITLLVLDIFFSTEVISWVSLLFFAIWGTGLVDIPVQWSVLLFIFNLVVAFTLYYLLWARFVRGPIMKYVNAHSVDDPLSKRVGMTGTVCGSGENLTVRCGDQYWSIADASQPGLKAGDKVIITEDAGSEVSVRPLS